MYALSGRRRIVHKVLFGLTSLAAASCLAADIYPDRPMRVIVAFAPGGGADATARVILPDVPSMAEVGNPA